MSKELSVYKDYAWLVKRCLLGCGLYPHQHSIVSKCLPVALILSYCINGYAVFTFLRQHVTKISVVIACCSVINGLANSIIKTLQFVICRKKLAQVNHALETLFAELSTQQSEGSPAMQLIVPFYRLGYYQYLSLGSAAMLFSIKPLMAMTIRHANHSTPFPSIYPWPIESTAVFALHYLFEAGIWCSFFSISIGVDVFFSLCALYIASMFRAMSMEMRELSKGPNNVATSVRVLRRCVERHALLIKCRDTIQEIYGPIVVFVTTLNTIGMCSMIFEILQSDIFQREVYCNDWYDHIDVRSAKFSLMILTQRKMILKAYSLMNISLDLFATIMNRTISYYFLLITLESD